MSQNMLNENLTILILCTILLIIVIILLIISEKLKEKYMKLPCFIIKKENRKIIGFKNVKNEKLIIPNIIKEKDICYKVIFIGLEAFANCKELEEVVLPSSLLSIEEYAFENCDRLKKVIIPDSVKGIMNYAFENCYSLEEIVIPNNIIYVSTEAFYNCKNLKRIIYKSKIYNNVYNLGSRERMYQYYEYIKGKR